MTSATGEPSALLAILILLAVPLAVGGGLSLLVGARRRRHVTAFLLGYLLIYLIVGAFLSILASGEAHPVGELGFTDREILEICVALAEVASVVATMALIAGLLLAERVLKSDVGRRHWTHSLLAGAVTALVVLLLQDYAAGVLFLWVLILMPFVYALVWFRESGKGPAESDPKAV